MGDGGKCHQYQGRRDINKNGEDASYAARADDTPFSHLFRAGEI